jgi:hypothetical protein
MLLLVLMFAGTLVYAVHILQAAQHACTGLETTECIITCELPGCLALSVLNLVQAALQLGLRATRRPVGYWDSPEVLDMELDVFIAGDTCQCAQTDSHAAGSCWCGRHIDRLKGVLCMLTGLYWRCWTLSRAHSLRRLVVCTQPCCQTPGPHRLPWFAYLCVSTKL